MALSWRSRFVYGDTGDFTLSLPVRAWIPADDTVGGVRIAAGGVPATYIVRRDVLIELVLRFYESEWPDVLALVTFGQSGEDWVWYPDADAVANYNVYLHAPAPGTRWTPTRDSNFARVFELTLTLRGVDGALPWTEYFTV